MTLPIEHKALEQIRPAQEGRIDGRCAADNDVISAACASVATVRHVFVGAQPRLARVFIQAHRRVDGLAP